MKVLLLANDSTYVYNLRREVIEAMLAKGWQVAAACDRKQHAEELEQMGCRLLPLEVARHGKNPLQDLALLRSYGRLLDAERPDVVLTYNIKPNVYGGMACAKRGIPYLVNVCGLGTPVENPGPMQVLTVALYKRGVKKAACVFFQNQENEDFFNARRMAPGHHHLLPGSGVNTARCALLPYPKGETVDFLFISRVMKEKGIDQYLEAARVIHARQIQTERFAHIPDVHCNAQMTSKLLHQYAQPDTHGLELLRNAMNRLNLSARAYDRILKVARTIADLDGSPQIQTGHLAEAISYRNLDRENWAG